ncbi:MAG: TlpA disulfide reductase family protein [Planctomycetota bacterium]
MRQVLTALASIALTSAAVARPAQADGAGETGYTRMTLDIGPGLPFVIESAADGANGSGDVVILNAGKRLPVRLEAVLGDPGASRDGVGAERFAIPPYASEVLLPGGWTGTRRVMPDGSSTSGTWTIERTEGPVSVALSARPVAGPHERFDPIEGVGEPADFAGRWRVRFGGDTEDAVGLFEVDRQTGLAIGTFLTPTGDYGHLAGRVDGNLLRLSTFDGAHAFLFHATMRVDGTLSGTFWSGSWWEQPWTAERDASVTIGDGFARTAATVVDFDTADVGNLSFTTADRIHGPAMLSGFMPAGEPRLLYVFGTWCPNCTDATAFIKELHETYGPRGLHVGAIAFERDLETAPQRVAAYRDHHGTEWGILIGGLSDKAKAGEALPFLDKVRSYPTAIFIHRDGRIEAIYSGFSGPATGEAYAQLRSEWIERVEALLGE